MPVMPDRMSWVACMLCILGMTVVIIAAMAFWIRLYRMIDDVHRIDGVTKKKWID
jgi:hypothetical protein